MKSPNPNQLRNLFLATSLATAIISVKLIL